MAELVDALVSNTCGKPCRFDSGFGYKPLRNRRFFYFYTYVLNFKYCKLALFDICNFYSFLIKIPHTFLIT